MTEKELLKILNKGSFDVQDVTHLVDGYCDETKRSKDDFTKIMEIILHILPLQEKGIQNILEFFKRKYHVVKVQALDGRILFYKSLL